LLAWLYSYFDALADLPVVNVGNAKFVVKVISADKPYLNLLVADLLGVNQ
jgi:hypothetical protein